MGRKKTSQHEPGPVGRNVKRLRLARGWSQSDLAARAKRSPGTIAKLELGVYQSPDLSTVDAIASAFGVSSAELLALTPASDGVQPYLEAFLRSPWASTIVLTRDEREWLESIPHAFWRQSFPSAETIAQLVMWRRKFG